MVRMKTEIAYKNSWYLMACIFLGNDNGRLNCGLEFWLLATPYYRKADCFCEPKWGMGFYGYMFEVNDFWLKKILMTIQGNSLWSFPALA